jgi:hypothetical protein
MPHKPTFFRNRWRSAFLFTPTLLVSGLWIASAFTEKSWIGFPTPLTWNCRIVPNYIRLEKTSAAIPVTTLPAGAIPPTWGNPPFNGLTVQDSGIDNFGWIKQLQGHYLQGTQATPTRIVSISLAIPFILSLPLSWIGFRLWKRPSLQDRRRRDGLCPTCGYDVRASPNQCPECGVKPT